MLEKRLHAKQREDLILDILKTTGFVTVSEIAKRSGVTEMTARRDLDQLATRDRLIRIHGGALHPDNRDSSEFAAIEPAVNERANINLAGKRAIAQRALQHVAAGEMIALDLGSTMQTFAQLLGDLDVRVITCSLPVASRLAHSRTEVYLPGGRIAGLEPSVSGPIAIEHLNEYWIDTFFLGCSGVSTEGFFDYSPEDTQIKKALIRRSKRKIALVDASKFGRASVAHIAPLSGFDAIITDANPGKDLEAHLKANNVALEIAAGS